MKKVLPLHKRRGRALLCLLVTVLCLLLLWLLAGMPSHDPTVLARSDAQCSLVEVDRVLYTGRYNKGKSAFVALRGTDGKVWLGRYQRYQYVPLLYQPTGYGLEACDNLDGAAYFCESLLAAEHAYLVLRDERTAAVKMTVRFTLDGLQHEEAMNGWDVGNGVFQLDLNEMLNTAQGRVYDSVDPTTYDRSLYWFVFPSHLGLSAFDAYDIRAYDAAGNEIGCWTA